MARRATARAQRLNEAVMLSTDFESVEEEEEEEEEAARAADFEGLDEI